ncbi:MAG: hypothetical protein ABW040_04950 [Microbacteriaceae bacterium]
MAEPFAAKLLGVIEGCTNPESAELLPDGETFVFGNCAMTMGIESFRGGMALVYLEGEAFISRARIRPDKTVELDERSIIDGETATLGCDVLTVATGRFPAGSVFMETGGRPITRDRASIVESSHSKVLVFDPIAGTVLGAIPLHAGSPFAERFNEVDQPNGLAIDSQGNLYVGDIPNSNPDPDPQAPPPVPPAVYRIPHDVIDSLADGSSDGLDRVQRVMMPNYVNGLTVSPVDDVCHAVSCNLASDPVGGGVYRLTQDDFDRGEQPDPIQRDLGVLDGIGVTRRGTLITSNPMTGELAAFRSDGTRLEIQVEGSPVRMPADFNVCYPSALDGEPALLIPDISVGQPPGGGVVAVADISGL